MTHLDLEPILSQVRRIPELKEGLRVVLAEWAKRLEEANTGHNAEITAVSEEMKTKIDEVFGALVEGTPVDPNNPFNAVNRQRNTQHPQMPRNNPTLSAEENRQMQDRRLGPDAQKGEFDSNLGQMVLERDTSGFARITESVPGVNPLTGRAWSADSRVARDSGAVIDEDHPHASQKLPDNLADQVPTGNSVSVEKLNIDSSMTGQKFATSADDIQQPSNSPLAPQQFPTEPVIRAEMSRVSPQASTAPVIQPVAASPQAVKPTVITPPATTVVTENKGTAASSIPAAASASDKK